MFDQLVITLVSTVTGSVLTLFVTYFTQLMTHKAEKRKIEHDKREELYTLSFQLKNWAEDTCKELWSLYDSPPGTHYTPSQLPCPIERVEILTRLYAPSLRKEAAELRNRAITLQTFLDDFMRPYEDDEYYMEKGVELTYNQYFSDSVREARERFIKTYEKYLVSLEKLILKS